MKLLAIPRRRLPDIVKRTVDAYNKDDVSGLAASITYFAFSSLFPLILFVVAVAGIFMNSADAFNLIFNFLQQSTPDPSIVAFLITTVDEILRNRPASGVAAVVALVGLLFTASGVFGTIDKAINTAWGCQFAPSLIKDKLISFAGVLGVVAILIVSLLLASAINVVKDASEPFLGIVPGNKWIWYTINLASSLLVNIVVLTLVYRSLPRCKVMWREVWPGAVLAAVLWEVLKQGFALYLGNFANFGAVYGTLGTLVALLTWIWLSCQVLLLGAEFAAEYAREAERYDAERDPINHVPTRSARLKADQQRRLVRRRRYEEEKRRKAILEGESNEGVYAPASRSLLVVIVAAVGAALAALATRLWRRE